MKHSDNSLLLIHVFFSRLGSFHPGQCEWIYNPGDAISTVACSEKTTGKIFVYDGRGGSDCLHVFDKMHSSPLSQMRLNPKFRVIVSADKAGMLEYWTGLPSDFKFPKHVDWEFKTDTDLYEFAKHKTYPTSLAFSFDGRKMATIASDRKVRIFRFLTGKLTRVFDESLTVSSNTRFSLNLYWCEFTHSSHMLHMLDVHRAAADEAAAAWHGVWAANGFGERAGESGWYPVDKYHLWWDRPLCALRDHAGHQGHQCGNQQVGSNRMKSIPVPHKVVSPSRFWYIASSSW